jgi:hypothetical protein
MMHGWAARNRSSSASHQLRALSRGPRSAGATTCLGCHVAVTQDCASLAAFHHENHEAARGRSQSQRIPSFYLTSRAFTIVTTSVLLISSNKPNSCSLLRSRALGQSTGVQARTAAPPTATLSKGHRFLPFRRTQTSIPPRPCLSSHRDGQHSPPPTDCMPHQVIGCAVIGAARDHGSGLSVRSVPQPVRPAPDPIVVGQLVQGAAQPDTID